MNCCSLGSAFIANGSAFGRLQNCELALCLGPASVDHEEAEDDIRDDARSGRHGLPTTRPHRSLLDRLRYNKLVHNCSVENPEEWGDPKVGSRRHHSSHVRDGVARKQHADVQFQTR